MAITDYIPNVFGSAAPTTYEGLLGMGLITPEQMKKQQNVANIQGLLGAGLALAQGMSKIGPRRSAAENILGALAGGFGAAGGAYQQGLQNVVQQQQLQSAALTQAQAANKVKSIQAAKLANPDLAYLADIDTGEFVKQVMARDRAKLYGFGTTEQQVAPQSTIAPPLAEVQQEGVAQNFVGVPAFGAAERIVPSAAPVAPAVAPTVGNVPQQGVSLVDPASVAKANDARRKAALAMSMGDKDTAAFFQNEAERLDPKEQLFFRDDKLVSSKRGIIGDFSGGKILTDEQATALGLDPNRGKWTIKGGIPSLVSGTEKQTRPLTESEIKTNRLDTNKRYQINQSTGVISEIPTAEQTRQLTESEIKTNRLDPNKRYQINQATGVISEIPTTAQTVKLTDAEAAGLGYKTNAGQIYFRLPSGEVKQMEGSGQSKLLTAEEVKNNTQLDPNKSYQINSKGEISVVSDIGTVANKADLIKVLPSQFTNVYPTLKSSVDALISRAPTMTRDQIIQETEKILSDDAKIREQLDPKLAAQREKERKAGGTVVYPAGSMPLGKEGGNKVDTQLLELGQSRLRLQSISSNFNPKFLETPFKLRMEAVAQLEKLGQRPNPKDAADLAAYSEFAQTAYNELNAYINLITGAAVGSGDEEARLRKGVPDPQKDSPTQFLTKLNTKIKEGRLYEARLGYIKNKGMKITDAGLVDVNQIPTLMRNREADLKKTNRLFGNKEYNPNDPNHKAIVRSILAQEFGLVD
jgi:hypothetical protein